MKNAISKNRKFTKREIHSAVFQVFCIAVGMIIMFPLFYAFFISFMGAEQIFSTTAGIIPERWTLENYKDALETAPFFRFIWNSLLVSLISSVIRVITASLAAFAFAFLDFPGKKVLFYLVIATFLIPGDVTIAANYRTIASLKLINTLPGVMAIYLVSGMNIFMLRQSFKSFSLEIRDASYIDGCTNFQFFWRILLPSNQQTLLTVFITSFMGVWNSYLWPLMVTNKTSMRTVQVGITMLNFSDGNPYGPIMAASMIVIIPSLIMFLMFRKHIVEGMMAGGVKG